MKNPRFNTFYFLFVLAAVCFHSSALEPIKLSLGTTHHGVQPGKSTQIYQFAVPDPPEDLTVYLTSNGDNFYRMFATKFDTELRANSTKNDYYTLGTHFLLIDIKARQLPQGSAKKIYYIGVDCVSGEQCDYQLRFEHPTNYTASVNERVYPRSSKNGSDSIVVFKIPKNDTTERVIINAARLYTRSNSSMPMKAYISREIGDAENPVVSLMDFDTAWDSGLATIIHKTQPDFCTDCNWTLRLIFDDPVVVQARTYGPVERIRQYIRFDDVAMAETQNTYVIHLDEDRVNENSSVLLTFQFYEGLVNYFIHPDVLPSRLQDYLWNISSYGEEVIRLSALERKKFGFNKKIYITVKPTETVAYSISYRPINTESKSWYGGQTLAPEKTYMSFIQDGEVQTFWYHAQCNLSTDLGVFANTGNVHVAVFRCEYLEDCYLTAANFSNLGAIQKLVYYSNSSKMWKSGSFNASHVNYTHYCHYAIGVLGASQNPSTNESSYEIWVDQKNTVTKLIEGSTFKAEMAAFVQRQFTFRIQNEANIERVTFRVTPLSGRGQYTLNFAPYDPNALPFHTTSTAWSIDVARSPLQTTLAGVYNLTLTALEASIFFITPVIHRKNTTSGTTTHKPLTLPAGVTLRHSISKDEVAYFQFRTNFPKNFSGSITVLIQPIRGKVTMYMNVNGKSLPSNKSDEHAWRSYGNQLTISSFYPDFNPQGLYQIAVYPQPYNRSQYYDTYSFSIAYINSEEFLYLRDGFPFDFTVSKSMPMYFEIDYSPEDGDLLFTKSSRSDYELFVSANPLIVFPNQTSYTARTQNTFSVALKENQLRSACHFSNSTSKYETCTIYLSAFTNYTYPVGGYIIVSKSKKTVDLAEGVSSYQPILRDQTYRFNYYPSSLSNLLVVKAWSQYKKVSVFAKVKSYRPQNHSFVTQPDLAYPTNKDFDFSAKGIVSHSMSEYKDEFVIPADKLKELCHSDVINCVVTLTVYPDTSGDVDSNEDIIEPPVFLIMVSGDYVILNSHTPVYDFVFKDQIRYYELSISKSKCQNCTLSIDITPVSQAKLYIVVSAGTSTRPTPEDNDFHLNGTHFKLTQEQAKRHSKEFYGEWTIGVYGGEDASYHIVASFDDNKETVILGGHPFEFAMDENDTKAFQYYLDSPDEIEIRSHVEKGRLSTEAYAFKSEQSREEPLNAYFIHRTLLDGTTLMVLPEETAKRITPCYISITLQAFDNNTLGNVVVLHPEDNIVLVDGHFYTDILEPGDKIYFKYQQMRNSSEKEALTINNYIDVQLFAGNITASVYDSPSRNNESLVLKHTPLDGDHFFSLYPQTQTDSHAKPYTNLFIKIEAHSHTKFSIVAGSENKKIKLADGVMHTDYLNQNQEVKYTVPLPIFNASDPFEVKININLYNYGSKSTLKDLLALAATGFPTFFDGELVVKQANNEEYRTRMPFTANYSSEKDKNGDYFASQLLVIGSYQLAAIFSVYDGAGQQASLEFKLRNSNILPTKYAIFVQSTKPLALPVGGLHFNRVSDKHSAIYEIYASKSGVLAIELVECYGKVRIDATDSIQKMQSNHWDLKVSRPSEEVLYGHLKVRQGTVYVRITVLDGVVNNKTTNEKVALYRFQTRLFSEQSVLPYDSFYRGGNGIVNWNIDTKNQSTVELVWSDAAVDQQENIFKDYDVEPIYNVLIARDRLTLEAYSKCGVLPNDAELSESHDDYLKSNKIYVSKSLSLQDFESQTQQKRNQQFDLKDNEAVTYYGVVVAKLNGYANGNNFTSWSIPLVYESVQISVGLMGGLSTPTWIVIAVVTLTLTVLVIGFLLFKYYKRYKLTKARLQFEMQDIRNVAHALPEDVIEKQVEQAQQARHTALVEEPQA